MSNPVALMPGQTVELTTCGETYWINIRDESGIAQTAIPFDSLDDAYALHRKLSVKHRDTDLCVDDLSEVVQVLRNAALLFEDRESPVWETVAAILDNAAYRIDRHFA